MQKPKQVVWDYSMILEVTIERPARDVWPWFFGEKNATWSKSVYTQVAGKPGEIGGVYSVVSAAHDMTWLFETVRLKVERELILKISYCRQGEEDRELMGYDIFELHESGARTTVAFQQAFALFVASDMDVGALTSTADAFHADIFTNLKRLVECERPQ